MTDTIIKPTSRFKRFLASMIDGLILTLVIDNACIMVINYFFNISDMTEHLVMIINMYLYYTYFETSKYSASPGKMVFKMRVLNNNNTKLTFWRASCRIIIQILVGIILGIVYFLFNEEHSYLLLFFVFIILCLYSVSIYFTKDRKLFHDIITGTKVVKIETKDN